MLNAYIAIREVGRLRHSHYRKPRKDWSRTLAFGPFKQVGGILSVLGRAFPLGMFWFFLCQ